MKQNLINLGFGVWGFFIILMGIGIMSAHVPSGLLIFATGVCILPPVMSRLKATNKQAVIAGLFLPFVGMVWGGLNAPPTNTAESVEQKEYLSEQPTQTIDTTPKLEMVEQENHTFVEPAPTDAELKAVQEKPATTYDVTCKIVGVSDGDTATCLTADKTQIKIRFDQIDAPETGQDFGSTSKKALSDLIFNKEVGLKTKEKDKYGRTVAEVFIDDKNINKEMVALGMAWAYREYMRDSEYEQLESEARNKSIGIWSQPNPIYPSDYRRMKRGDQQSAKQTVQINQAENQSMLNKTGGECGSKRYCKEMSSCAEAKHYLNVCGVSRLDRDGDGIPCEAICKR